MLEERDLKLDLVALGLLALTVFLAASLLSYHPADPPSTLVYPEQTETLNVCGRSGALVSRVLFGALGLGAFYLLFSLAVVDSLLLARREIDEGARGVVFGRNALQVSDPPAFQRALCDVVKRGTTAAEAAQRHNLRDK